MNLEQKYCARCGEWKDFCEFFQYKSGKNEGKYYSICNSCKRKMNKVWVRTHPTSEISFKVCVDCGKDKDITFFIKNKHYADGYDAQCKECKNAYRREYRKRKEVKEKEKVLKRFYRVKNWYGLSRDEYLHLSSLYSNCAICNTPLAEGEKCVDHDHATGKVRGILCSLCNVLLGCSDESVSSLAKAILYLENFDRSVCAIK